VVQDIFAHMSSVNESQMDMR